MYFSVAAGSRLHVFGLMRMVTTSGVRCVKLCQHITVQGDHFPVEVPLIIILGSAQFYAYRVAYSLPLPAHAVLPDRLIAHTIGAACSG